MARHLKKRTAFLYSPPACTGCKSSPLKEAHRVSLFATEKSNAFLSSLLQRRLIMNKIESFQIDHLKLLPGLYVSRKDRQGEVCVTTFDMRVTAPNREPVIDMPALHTIEHLGATFFRNGRIKESVVYFGPMGCRTGFYLVLFGDLASEDVYSEVLAMCDFILSFEGDIPGASAVECGNYAEQNLAMAKYYIARYKGELAAKRFAY